MSEGIDAQPARRRRKSERTKRTRNPITEQPPFAQPRLHMPPTAIVSDDELEAIHQASLRVLREIGVDFLHPEALRLLGEAGADVDGERVRFDPEMIAEYMAHIPPEFTLHGRLPERDLRIGANWITYSSVASAPNYVNLDGKRVSGDRAGFQDFLRLGQMLNSVHVFSGYPVEPIDLHASIRHLEAAVVSK